MESCPLLFQYHKAKLNPNAGVQLVRILTRVVKLCQMKSELSNANISPWSIELPAHRSASAQIYHYLDIPAHRSTSTQTYQYICMPIHDTLAHRFTSIQMYQYINILEHRCTSTQIYQHIDVPVHRNTSAQIYHKNQMQPIRLSKVLSSFP